MGVDGHVRLGLFSTQRTIPRGGGGVKQVRFFAAPGCGGGMKKVCRKAQLSVVSSQFLVVSIQDVRVFGWAGLLIFYPTLALSGIVRPPMAKAHRLYAKPKSPKDD